MTPCRQLRRAILASLLAAACLCPRPAPAGIFGVPTDLDASGSLTATSVNPPGWFTLTGTNAADGAGDAAHQLRLFIEVTGSTLDVLVFDPGNSGARDLTGTGNTTTSFQLYNPDGSLRSRVNGFGDDTATTDNQLVRFTPNNRGFYALDSTSNRNVSFSGLQPGVYEFRIVMGPGTDYNGFGVDIRVSKASPTPYNVFTIGKSAGLDSALTIGALDSGGTPYANISQRMVFYPYVTRGCSLQTSNFDMDTGTGNPGANSAGDITDVLGAVTSLTMSAATVHSENPIAIHPTTVTNLEVVNYGMYTLTNHSGTQQNLADWRVADDTGTAWSDDPANLPRNPTNPLRMYLPNGYAPPIPPNTNATAPAAPFMAASARVAGGANPPSGGQTTRFDLTATVENPTDFPLSNLQITIPIVADASFVTGSQVGAIDGTVTACTDGSGSGYRRCTFGSLPAGSVASLSIQADFTPPGSGLRNLTGPPTSTASGTTSPEGTTRYLPNDTAVWAQYEPAFDSTTYPRTEYLGPLCNLVLNVGAGVAAPTRASLVGLRVDPTGQVDFATGTQINTVAFNLYGAPDAERTSLRTPLTASPVPTPLPTSLIPMLYSVSTGPIASPFLYVEEIDRSGRRHLMGPLSITDPRLRDRLDRIEARLMTAGAQLSGGVRYLLPAQQGLWASTAAGTPLPASRRTSVPKGVRIEVAGDGVVEVPVSSLAAAGLPPRLLKSPRTLRLTNRGSPVPFRVVRGPGGQEVLTFQADYLPSDYAARNAYILSWGVTPPAFQAQITSSERPKQPGFARVELNQIYVPNAPQGSDPWLWELLVPGEPTSFSFDLPGLQAGSAAEVAVRVRLALLSTHQFSIQAWLNGTSIGSVTKGGGGSYLMQGRIPAEALLSVGNQLVLSYSATGNSFEEPAFYLDYLELGSPLDKAAASIAPDRIVPYDPSLPNFRGADYLIISHPLFLDQAESIASHKAREGYRPVVVDVERAYDRFSAGIVEPTAIRALIGQWAGGGIRRVRHLLLVGDDTFDPRNYTGTGETPFIPSLNGWDPEFGRVPSENRYADVDGDGQPDISIGRLPVQTPEQAAILADKIARQASVLAQNGSRHLLAVDNQGPDDIPFRALAEEVAAGFFPQADLTWADVGAPGGIDAARSALLQGLRDGALLTHYFGHAGPETWADEGLLTADDLGSLANTYRETVLFTWACEAQFFQSLFGPSVNEALLLLPGGGALASFGPAGITDPIQQRMLYTRLYRKFLIERLTLGEAVRQAKAATIAEFPESRPVIEGWNLLGDPTLRLPR